MHFPERDQFEDAERPPIIPQRDNQGPVSGAASGENGTAKLSHVTVVVDRPFGVEAV